jgi:hypothetical protein
MHYGSGKPSPRITHGERDETSDQTRLKPTDDPWIKPTFCSHHKRLQAQYNLHNNGIPDQVQHNLRNNGIPDHVTVSCECPFTQDTSRWEILAIHTVVFQHRAVWYTVISVHEGIRCFNFKAPWRQQVPGKRWCYLPNKTVTPQT